MGMVYENGHARGVNSPNILQNGYLAYHGSINYSAANSYIGSNADTVFSYDLYDIIYNNLAYYNFITIFASINLNVTNSKKYDVVLFKISKLPVYTDNTPSSYHNYVIYTNHNSSTNSNYEGTINRTFIIRSCSKLWYNQYIQYSESDAEWKDVSHYSSDTGYLPKFGIETNYEDSYSSDGIDLYSSGHAYFSLYTRHGDSSSKTISSISITGDVYCYFS